MSVRYLAVAASLVVLGALGALALRANHLACGAGGTGDPLLCPKPVRATPDDVDDLRAAIARNPGAARAYAYLAAVSPAPDKARAIQAARTVAPHDPNVLLGATALALAHQNAAQAVPMLVELVDYHAVSAPQAAATLAQLIASERAPGIEQHLRPGSKWFKIVLEEMVRQKLPVAPAAPLVATAVERDLLPPAQLRQLTESLKRSGHWADAYGLWLAQHRRTPVLFNGDFEEPLRRGGFDWEFDEDSRPAGAIVSRRLLSGHGFVLDVLFNGRPATPPYVRQILYLAPGSYHLNGQFRADKLRADARLGWTVLCVTGGQNLGRFELVADPSSSWERMALDFQVPPGCGPVVSLQLEPAERTSATIGTRGRVNFDNFSLTAEQK